MTINRDDAVAALASFAGPLGPLTTLDERLERLDRWVHAAESGLVAILADIVASPPAPLPASPDDWEVLLVEVAGKVSRAHADQAITHVLPLLDHSGARTLAIDILGGVGDERAIPRLADLLARSDVSDDDRIRVVGALGDIGGEEAARLLRSLKASTPPTRRECHDEIDLALRAVARLSGAP